MWEACSSLILHQKINDPKVQLGAQAEQSHSEMKKIESLAPAVRNRARGGCTAAENSQDADTSNAHNLGWSNRHPHEAHAEQRTTSPLSGGTYRRVRSLWGEALQKEKFNLTGWLNDGWSHSRRVVQRAKDKFGWSRHFYVLAHCRIAPVEQCILGNER